MLLYGSILLGSTEECILVWQRKNGKNGTRTGFVDNFTVTKNQLINRKHFPCLDNLYGVDVCLWRGVKGFAVMPFCLIFGAVLQKFYFIFRYCSFVRPGTLRYLEIFG